MIEIYKRYDDMLVKECIFRLENYDIECQPIPGTSNQHLRWMLHELMKGEMPKGKTNRWLGFIQGVMIMKVITSVQEERDFTRPYFKGEE